jgi:hypothetical protein
MSCGRALESHGDGVCNSHLPTVERKLFAMRCPADSVVDVSGGFLDDLLSRLWAMPELKMRTRCNSGTLWPGPGVRMACFIVASVECCFIFGRALH